MVTKAEARREKQVEALKLVLQGKRDVMLDTMSIEEVAKIKDIHDDVVNELKWVLKHIG